MMFMIGAFTLALVLTLMTFMVLRRTVIQPLQQSASRIERIAAGDLTMAEKKNTIEPRQLATPRTIFQVLICCFLILLQYSILKVRVKQISWNYENRPARTRMIDQKLVHTHHGLCVT
ncbi:hypothetical protein A6V37_38420 [Paraburkholderia ginsengiterrae]|uniref:HAMP domain-containing protein n=1 Tax=Paraburkholderia ginsengiterrae TaxID=1462993 RepID=A0A1A9N6W0_9BURK|nr:hypothetical protein A6V37_38420 [Paraburkholderia ginsengiterrae]